MRISLNLQKPKKLGFALVATISLLSLLLLISLAIVSLAVTSSQTSSNIKQLETARANARLALTQAVQMLQANAGVDQVVTGRGDINIKANPKKNYWMGIWGTADWDPTDPNDKTFKGWAVSGMEKASEASIEEDLAASSVTILGNGSVNHFDQQVVAPLVDINDEQNRTTGRIAWWVSDEGVKASASAPSLSSAKWNNAALTGVAASSGLEGAGLLQHGPEVHKATISRDSMIFPYANITDQNTRRQLLKESFHDLTPCSVNLLTDVRHGGFKRDLSTAFELDLYDFNQIEEFHNGEENNWTNFYDHLSKDYSRPELYHSEHSPDLGYVAEIPTGYDTFARSVSWDYLRNYYRLYKNEWDSLQWNRAFKAPKGTYGARGSLPFSYSSKLKWKTPPGAKGVYATHANRGISYGKAIRGRLSFLGKVDSPRGEPRNNRRENAHKPDRSPQLAPVVTRATFAFGVARKESSAGADWSLAFTMDPYVTVYNPYSVPISYESISFWVTKFNPVTVTVEWQDKTGKKRKTVIRAYFSDNYYSYGTYTMRLDPAAGPYTLQPGEIKVISPKKYDKPTQFDYQGFTVVEGGYSYSEDSGLYVAQSNVVKPAPDSDVKVRFTGKTVCGGREAERFNVSLMRSKDHLGKSRDVFTHLPSRRFYSDFDIHDDTLISNIGIACFNSNTAPRFNVEKTFSSNEIPAPGATGKYLAVLDVAMKTLSENASAMTFEPRSRIYDPRDFDGSSRGSIQWGVELKPIDDLLELELVANPSSQGLWGEGRTFASSGVTNIPLLDIPRLPVSSMSQLQHLQSGFVGNSASLQIGNSFANPGMRDLTKIWEDGKVAARSFSSIKGQTIIDDAWALNDALWDSYVFTGMNWGESVNPFGDEQAYATQEQAIDALIAADRSKPWPLQNPRLSLNSYSWNSEEKAELFNYDTFTKHLSLHGGFNVNSTSVKAWEALFFSMNQQQLRYQDGDTVKTETVDNLFSRFQIPIADKDSMFGGYRELSDDEIKKLAEEMVVQVKQRGPFMGLGDFVNRRLSNEELGESGYRTSVGRLGALQAAIEAAGLNDDIKSVVPSDSRVKNIKYKAGGKSKTLNNYQNTTQYLLQGDLLNSLSGVLSARSDTFIVRAYGCALNEDGTVAAEAWCEASVQRYPEWKSHTAEPTIKMRSVADRETDTLIMRQFELNPDLPESVKSHGRQMRVISFKWLTKDEV